MSEEMYSLEEIYVLADAMIDLNVDAESILTGRKPTNTADDLPLGLVVETNASTDKAWRTLLKMMWVYEQVLTHMAVDVWGEDVGGEDWANIDPRYAVGSPEDVMSFMWGMFGALLNVQRAVEELLKAKLEKETET